VILYIDTSALAKNYLEEISSRDVRNLIDGARQIVTSVLTELEVTSTLERAKHGRRINSPSYRTAVESFEKDLRREVIAFIAISQAIIDDAKRIIKHHRLRPPDAIQVASAKHAMKAISPLIEFLCFDEAVVDAAKREGLRSVSF